MRTTYQLAKKVAHKYIYGSDFPDLPYYNDTPRQQAEKVVSLLRIVYAHGDLGVGAKRHITNLANKIKQNSNQYPRLVLSEPEARKLRSYIFKSKRNFISQVPSLPGGVKFDDEVRRLLKEQANPNEDQNSVITAGESFLVQMLAQHKANLQSQFGDHLLTGGTWERADNIEVEYLSRRRNELTYKVKFDFSIGTEDWSNDSRVDTKITIIHDGQKSYRFKNEVEGNLLSDLGMSEM